MKPFVYIASPYTTGDVGINTRFQCRTWDDMMNDGIVLPYAPLWSHFQHTIFPRRYQDWIGYDNEILPRMDALISLNAIHSALDYNEQKSSGADDEVELALRLNMPVFYNIFALYTWARGWQSEKGKSE